MESQRVTGSGVPYRQGWVEVVPNIHAGFVNLEAWSVTPEVDVSDPYTSLSTVPDEAVTGNVEVELSVAQARQLVMLLQAAIEATERAGAQFHSEPSNTSLERTCEG
ncbi:MAG: hypothetical protein ACAF41_09675 [Leptolyngbya sp. BL-A-14]